MGYKCKFCGMDNGITFYYGKCCKKCGKDLGKITFPPEQLNPAQTEQ